MKLRVSVTACVVHNTLNSAGGGEKVCLEVIRVLKNLGFRVILLTVDRTDWERLKHVFGENLIRPDEEHYLMSRRIMFLGIYLRLMTATLVKKWKNKCDLVINTHGDVLPVSSDIIYMHFPTFAILHENPVNAKYSRSVFWRLYFQPYERIQQHLVKRMTWKILVTNSEYSREIIKKYVGADAVVIYPPVDVKDFLGVSANTDRANEVVSCGRFTPEKNYELVLEVAEHLPHINFTIIGASSGRISSSYYHKLEEIIRKKRLRNIRLLRNISRMRQIEIYSRSKVFLHAMINEHFGIAVVEGMAAGLVPVVHESGGPWNDIINRGKYGFGYTDIEDAVDAVEKALKLYDRYSKMAVMRAKAYRREEFAKRFASLIEKLLDEKNLKLNHGIYNKLVW